MFSLKDLILTKGIAATPKFSSTAERIEFFADIVSDSFDIEYRILPMMQAATKSRLAQE